MSEENQEATGFVQQAVHGMQAWAAAALLCRAAGGAIMLQRILLLDIGTLRRAS
jgi:hypothetical protein